MAVRSGYKKGSGKDGPAGEGVHIGKDSRQQQGYGMRGWGTATGGDVSGNSAMLMSAQGIRGWLLVDSGQANAGAMVT